MFQADGAILRPSNRLLPPRQMYLAWQTRRVTAQSDSEKYADASYRLIHFAKLGTVTASTFLIIFAPWLRPFPGPLLQVISRIFPFARGIFEDKVANFWCASNVVIKWRKWVTVSSMAKVSSRMRDRTCADGTS